MKLYADLPGTRARQTVTDVLVATWAYVWVVLAMKLYDLVEKLAVPGRKLEEAGGGLADNLAGAGERIDDVPGVGGAIAAPFARAADAARALADAGKDQQAVIHDLAWALSIMLVVVPLGLVLLIWLPLRVRWVRRASGAAKLRSAGAGRDLLALRALATQPVGKLTKLDPQIASRWRKGDAEAVEALARLELRSLGLR